MIACGGLLALAAAPRWSSLSLADGKRLLLFYIGGSVIAALILFALTLDFASDHLRSHSLINPLFNRGRAWPITFITYAAVVLACGGIWMAAFQLYSRSRNVLKSRECWSGARKPRRRHSRARGRDATAGCKRDAPVRS